MRTQDFRPTTTLIHTLSDEVISTNPKSIPLEAHAPRPSSTPDLACPTFSKIDSELAGNVRWWSLPEYPAPHDRALWNLSPALTRSPGASVFVLVCLCERLPRTPLRGFWVCVWP